MIFIRAFYCGVMIKNEKQNHNTTLVQNQLCRIQQSHSLMEKHDRRLVQIILIGWWLLEWGPKRAEGKMIEIELTWMGAIWGQRKDRDIQLTLDRHRGSQGVGESSTDVGGMDVIIHLLLPLCPDAIAGIQHKILTDLQLNPQCWGIDV